MTPGTERTLRLAVAALTQKAYVGRVSKDGTRFLDGKQDVTNDFLKARSGSVPWHRNHDHC